MLSHSLLAIAVHVEMDPGFLEVGFKPINKGGGFVFYILPDFP